jgi:uncharacterized membrane protein YuzA (DUF378 family)
MREKLEKISYVIVLATAINVGIEGVLGADLISLLFGVSTVTTSVLYLFAGVAALTLIYQKYNKIARRALISVVRPTKGAGVASSQS